MPLKMFDSLLPYYGNKRKLCPVIFHHIAKYYPKDKWGKAIFNDAFLGSGAVSMFAKSQGFMVFANDISQRSIIAGKALIENGRTKLTRADIDRLFVPNANNKHLIEREYVPDVFTRRHARFLDNAFANAQTPLQQYLLLKYIFHIRPFSKFSSPNAFNRPMEDGLYDQIKATYTKHIKDNLKSPLEILKTEAESVNLGIFHNGGGNQVYRVDALEFVEKSFGEVLYLDPPYSQTMAYESEYRVLDTILGDNNMPVSKFSSVSGIDMLDALLAKAKHYHVWVISYGNAAGHNDLGDLVQVVKKYRNCEALEFAYEHCSAMATQEHKKQSREWLLIGHKS